SWRATLPTRAVPRTGSRRDSASHPPRPAERHPPPSHPGLARADMPTGHQHPPAVTAPGPPALDIVAGRAEAMGPVDVEQVDRGGDVIEGIVTELADVRHPVSHPRALDVGEEHLRVDGGLVLEALDLLRAPVVAGVGVDGHDLGAGRRRAGDGHHRPAPE